MTDVDPQAFLKDLRLWQVEKQRNERLLHILHRYRSALQDLVTELNARLKPEDEFEALWHARGELYFNFQEYPEDIDWQVRAGRAEAAVIDVYSKAMSWSMWKGPPPKDADAWFSEIQNRLFWVIKKWQEQDDHPLAPPVDRDVPAPQRLAELCNQLTKAGQGLAEARGRYSEARENRDVAERTFALLADQLMGAIQEHREGTPEGVPYQP